MITQQEFAVRQPYFPRKAENESYYLYKANALEVEIGKTEFGSRLPESMRKHLALCITGYLMDIVSDTGLWRSFVNANRELYGYSVPFQTTGEDYVDYELNREDIRFLVWYDIAMMDMERRTLDPEDAGLLRMADSVYDYLELFYEDAPGIDEYNIVRGLSMNDVEDQEEIMHLANWLFTYSWLLFPAYAMDMHRLAMDPEVRDDREGIILQKRLDEAVSADTTGPLAMFIQEWIYLLLKGTMPRSAVDGEVPADNIHPYYSKFVAATGGKEIAYFRDYEELNGFFIDKLGWEKGERHLNQMSQEHDFVLLVNKGKGMLLAKNVAKCIADPENTLYDKVYAAHNAMDLLTVRGLCPADLLSYVMRNGWLPDARFEGSDNCGLVSKNWNFIARCYLQEYYRGD